MHLGQERRREVTLRGASAREVSKEALLLKVAEERAARDRARKAAASARFIQRFVRGYAAAAHWKEKLRDDLDVLYSSLVLPSSSPSTVSFPSPSPPCSPLQLRGANSTEDGQFASCELAGISPSLRVSARSSSTIQSGAALSSSCEDHLTAGVVSLECQSSHPFTSSLQQPSCTVVWSSVHPTTPPPHHGGWFASSSTPLPAPINVIQSASANRGLSSHEIAKHIVTPVLFILRPRSGSAWRIVETAGDAERLANAFSILLKSIANPDPALNYCALAVGPPSESSIWHHQSRRLFSLCCALILGDGLWLPTSRGDDGREAERGKTKDRLIRQALGLMLNLTDVKLWKCFSQAHVASNAGPVTSEDMIGERDLSNMAILKDRADMAIKEMLVWVAEGHAGLYTALRVYVLGNCPLGDENDRKREVGGGGGGGGGNNGVLSTEGAIAALTVGLRVILVLADEQGKGGGGAPPSIDTGSGRTARGMVIDGVVTENDAFGGCDMGAMSPLSPPLASSGVVLPASVAAATARASAQLTWYLLTLPMLTKRIPSVLLTRLRQPAVLGSCLRALGVPLQSLGKVATKLSPHGSHFERYGLLTSAMDHSQYGDDLHMSAWALFNVLSLVHYPGGPRSVGFVPGIILGEYVHAVCNLLDEWLVFVEGEQQQLGKKEGSWGGGDNDLDGMDARKFRVPLLIEDDVRVFMQQWHIAGLFEKPFRADFELNEERYGVADLGRMYLGWLLVLSGLDLQTGGTRPLLDAIAFSPIVCTSFWEWLEDALGVTELGGMEEPHWEVASTKSGVDGLSRDITAVLGVFCAAYAHLLDVLDDSEFYEKQEPFNLDRQRVIAATLNSLVYNSLQQPSTSSAGGPSTRSPSTPAAAGSSSSTLSAWPGRSLQRAFVLGTTTRLLRSLYERDCRRPFCPPSLWLAPAVESPPAVSWIAKIIQGSSSSDGTKGKELEGPTVNLILTSIPHVLPFEQRVLIFRKLVNDDKTEHGHGEGGLGMRTSVQIGVRRDRIMEDGFAMVNKLGSKLKGRISVSFINEQGLAEAGIDYGGVFKEFLTDLAKTAFDPRYGLFVQTATEEGLLFPHRAAASLEMGLSMMEFLGRIVGKALYEGILLDYNFSPLFVSKLIGRYSFIDELGSLDAELHRNLMYLKHYEGDARDLALDFTVTEELFGNRTVIELRPGGADIVVTNENKLQYVHAIADYRLNKQMKQVTSAFVRGLSDLIEPSWLRLFNAREFNQLLSGGTQDIDIEDLKANTRYTGGYSSTSRTIQLFWEVIVHFEKEEKCALLKFVTSCSRPPLLGFQHLQPAFTIHKVPCETPFWSVIGGPDVDRLPSASTCYNTLKLPTYKRASTMREKLLYAITSNAGFELS